MMRLFFLIALVLLILVPFMPKLARLRIGVLRWLRWDRRGQRVGRSFRKMAIGLSVGCDGGRNGVSLRRVGSPRQRRGILFRSPFTDLAKRRRENL